MPGHLVKELNVGTVEIHSLYLFVCFSLQLLERDTAEVRDAVAENTSLIMK